MAETTDQDHPGGKQPSAAAPSDAPPASDPFAALDAVGQVALVRSGAVRPRELVEAAIARVEAFNPAVNAVIYKRYEAALAEAAAAERDPEFLARPFAGVPFLIKDLTLLAGAPTTYGCRFFERYRARHNEPLSDRAAGAGFLTIGKSNTSEFGLLGVTEPLLHGPARNPWNLALSPGGSSGGAAAAVSLGLTPIAHGGDGGGSIRIPASHTGLFGFKPSRGRCVAPARNTAGDLSVQFCLARSVRDAAAYMTVMEETGPEASFPAMGTVPGPSDTRLRVAVSYGSFLGDEPDPEVAAAVTAAARLLAELGHEVILAEAPNADAFSGPEDAIDQFLTLWSATPAAIMRRLWMLRPLFGQFARLDALFEPWTLSLARWHQERARERPGLIGEAVAYFRVIAAAYADFFQRFDVLLSPVTRRPPPLIGEQGPETPFETLLARSRDVVCYTPLFNATGAPAFSIPVHWAANGAPIGVQIAGPLGEDARLMALAFEMEAASPWADRWPAAPKASVAD